MNRARFIALVATLSLGPVAIGVAAPRPAPPPAQFVPEVIYPYKGSSFDDLRLSNASGTAAVLLYRGKGILSYDLARPSLQQATFIDTDLNNVRHLKVLSWTNNSSGGISVGPERILVSSPTLFLADFSPTGDRIAYRTGDSVNGYDLNIVDVASGTATKVATIPWLFNVRWSRDGNSLYYASFNTVNGVGQDRLAYRQPLAGGQPTLLFSEQTIRAWDISRDGTDGLIFTFLRPGFTNFAMGKWDGSTVTTLPFVNANDPHYSCGNDRLIYRSATNGSPGPVKVYTFATKSDVVFSRDKIITQADFMPCD